MTFLTMPADQISRIQNNNFWQTLVNAKVSFIDLNVFTR